MRQPELRHAFRLAQILGCTVHELCQRMSSSEFGQWQAFWGEETPDMSRAAFPALMAMIARAGGLQMRNGEAPTAAHFATHPWEDRQQMDAAQQLLSHFGEE